MQSRRNFLKSASWMVAGGLLAPQLLASCGGKSNTQAASQTAAEAVSQSKNIGLQLYSLRDDIAKQGIQPVLETVAKMGYKNLEMANYEDGKIYGLEPADFRKRVEDLGMRCVSAHVGQAYDKEKDAEIMAWWDRAIEAHRAVGAKFIIQPWMAVDDKTTLDYLKMYCDYYSRVGEKATQAGLIFGYHNHAFEFKQVEGTLIYDFLLNNVDKKNVHFELDVYWAQYGGGDPVKLLKEKADQIRAVHIKDEKEIGVSGKMNFEPIFQQMYASGIEDWFVEVEAYTDGNPVASVQQSYEFLAKAAYVK